MWTSATFLLRTARRSSNVDMVYIAQEPHESVHPASRAQPTPQHHGARATGRLHQALLQHDYIPGTGGTIKGTRHLSLDNGAALERYIQTFEYDRSGNLLALRHAGASQRWATELWVADDSNRAAPLLDPNGNPVSDPETQFETIMAVKADVFKAPPYPNWTAVGVNWLAGFDFEVKVIARIPDLEA